MKKILGLVVLAGLVFGVVYGVAEVKAIKQELDAVRANSGRTLGGFTEHTVKNTFHSGLHADFFSQGGGVLTIATTGAAYTMTERELENYSVIYTPATTAPSAAMALTLPATSTWDTLIPDTGDSRLWYIFNDHTAAATTTTVTAGTGIDLVGDTANDDVINGGGVIGVMECIRMPDTDIACSVSEKVAAD